MNPASPLVSFQPVPQPADEAPEAPAAIAALPPARARSRGATTFRGVVFVVAEVLAALVLWQLVVWVFHIDPRVLPGPIDVLGRLWSLLGSDVLWSAIGVTLSEVVLGFLLGAAIGMILAVVLSEYRVLEKVAQPYIVAFQAMPKIAIAPLFLIWFGFGLESKVLLVALMVFFPILVNMVAGLTSPTEAQLELMAVYRANRVKTLRHLRWYCAMPYMFASLEVTLVLAVTGAVFAEIIGSGTTIGLGTLLQLYTARIEVTMVFAIIIVMSVIGILLYAAVKFAGFWALRWQRRA
jgi:NitT/TauT family transport system permease protein